MSAPELSIIVPVYNVEKYLRICVDSILAQDGVDYEVILVDDGSTDASGDIADSYASEDSRVKVLHQANAGLSAARNAGLGVAAGEYVQFVDSDDSLEPGTLKALMEQVWRENLDVLRFNWQHIDEAGNVFVPYKEYKPFTDFSDNPCRGVEFLDSRLGYACYAPQFIIRRSLLEGCCFREGIYFEDAEWTPRMLLRSNRVSSTPLVVYNYRMRRGSITQAVNMEKKRKVMEDQFALLESTLALSKTAPGCRWFGGMLAFESRSFLESLARDFYPERRTWLKRFRCLGLRPLRVWRLSNSVARKVRIINLSPALFCLMIHLKNGRQA